MAGLTYAYARVSTVEQNLDRQLDLFQAQWQIPLDRIYQDKMSGSKHDRPALKEISGKLASGDTLIVESLSRLSRSTLDTLYLVQGFTDKGVKVISIKENFDFSTSTGKLVLTVLAAIAEMERENIRQRVREGLTSARIRGRLGGRPAIDRRKIDKALKLYESNTHTVSEICDVCGISRSTFYRALKK